MSNPGEPQKSGPAHPSVDYEPRDVSTSLVVKALVAVFAGMILAGLASLALILWLPTPQPQAGWLVPQLRQRIEQMLPPEPRLQPSPGHADYPQEELRQLRQEADAKLNSYAWQDRQAGIARIPIGEAMRLFAERGSVRPPGAAPAPTHVHGGEH